jgi:hypothetical protein
VHDADVAVAIDACDTNVVVATVMAVDPDIVVDARRPRTIAASVFNSLGIFVAVTSMALKPGILASFVVTAATGSPRLVLSATMLLFAALGELGLLVPATIFAAFSSLGATTTLLVLGDVSGVVVIAATPAAFRVGLGWRRNGQRRRAGG